MKMVSLWYDGKGLTDHESYKGTADELVQQFDVHSEKLGHYQYTENIYRDEKWDNTTNQEILLDTSYGIHENDVNEVTLRINGEKQENDTVMDCTDYTAVARLVYSFAIFVILHFLDFFIRAYSATIAIAIITSGCLSITGIPDMGSLPQRLLKWWLQNQEDDMRATYKEWATNRTESIEAIGCILKDVKRVQKRVGIIRKTGSFVARAAQLTKAGATFMAFVPIPVTAVLCVGLTVSSKAFKLLGLGLQKGGKWYEKKCNKRIKKASTKEDLASLLEYDKTQMLQLQHKCETIHLRTQLLKDLGDIWQGISTAQTEGKLYGPRKLLRFIEAIIKIRYTTLLSPDATSSVETILEMVKGSGILTEQGIKDAVQQMKDEIIQVGIYVNNITRHHENK